MTARQARLRPALATFWILVALVVAHGCSHSDSTGPGTTAIKDVIVSPDSVGLSPAATESLSAEARNGANRPVPNQTFFWSTSDSQVATVSQSGVVTGQHVGAAQISASTQGISGFAKIVVVIDRVHSVTVAPAADTEYATPPGNSVTLQATTLDAQGHVLTGRPVLWTSNSGLATVNNGVVTATNSAAGTATITATSPDSGFPSGSAFVTVIGHVASVQVTPSSATISTSGVFFATTVQLTAQLIDTFGNDVSAQRQVVWTSSDSTVATVDQHTGLVTAVASSSTAVTITATSPDGVTGTASITVFQ